MVEFNLIQAPELVRRLARTLGLRQAHITPTLEDTVQPVVLLRDLTRPHPADELLVVGQAVGQPVVGLIPAVALWNPPETGKRLQVHRIWLSSVLFPSWRMALRPSVLTPPLANAVAGNAFWEDLARPAIPASAGQLIGGTSAIPTPHWRFDEDGINFAHTFYGQPLELRGVFLHPGQAIEIFTATVNTQFFCSMEWEEQPDEREQ